MLPPWLFFSIWQLFNDIHCVIPLGLQVTQITLGPSTALVVQMNFWSRVFPSSQIVRDKGEITLLKIPLLGTLQGRVWARPWSGWSFGLTHRAFLLLDLLLAIRH